MLLLPFPESPFLSVYSHTVSFPFPHFFFLSMPLLSVAEIRDYMRESQAGKEKIELLIKVYQLNWEKATGYNTLDHKYTHAHTTKMIIILIYHDFVLVRSKDGSSCDRRSVLVSIYKCRTLKKGNMNKLWRIWDRKDCKLLFNLPAHIHHLSFFVCSRVFSPIAPFSGPSPRVPVSQGFSLPLFPSLSSLLFHSACCVLQ